MARSNLLIVTVIGTFLVAGITVGGLIYLAAIDRTQSQPVVTILSQILTALVAAAAAVITHYISGTQEQQRIILNGQQELIKSGTDASQPTQ